VWPIPQRAIALPESRPSHRRIESGRLSGCIKTEIDRWSMIVRNSGIKSE
jgi:hypothetical protein